MISVIICTYNRDKYIHATLSRLALAQKGTEMEVLLIDNNSSDNTKNECARFQKEHPSVNFRYIVETEQGLSYARNRGIDEAKGDMLVFLDDDSFVTEHYLTNLKAYMDKYPEMQVFGGKISPLYELGMEPEWMTRWTYSWVSAIDKGRKVGFFKGSEFPIGANMGFRKSVAAECGYFNVRLGRNEKKLLGGEEKDFFQRAKSKGLQIYYLPDVAVDHYIPPTRTTMDFVKRMATGVGMSERIRTQSEGKWSYRKRCLLELGKWGATLILAAYYLVRFTPAKGKILCMFRRNVSKGLLGLS